VISNKNMRYSSNTNKSIRKKRITADDLWKLDRIGAVSLSPDEAQAVCAVSRYELDTNKGSTSLYLLSTLGGEPRHLTACGDKDAEPQWSPIGDCIAFVAKREQEGSKDELPQIYLIASDGGEARRLTQLATGVNGIKWFPDGKRIAFISWVWPELKTAQLQADKHKAFKERKESAYVTEQYQYRYWDHNLPMGREPHLHVVDVATGKVTDLFNGTGVALRRNDPNAHCYDISPDGKRIVFTHDPQYVKRIMNVQALSLIQVASRTLLPLLAPKAWTLSMPKFSHNGKQLAFVAANVGKHHIAPDLLAVADVATRKWRTVSQDWDTEVASELNWAVDDRAIYLRAEEQGRCHLWRFDLSTTTATVVATGGWVQGFDVRGQTIVSVQDSMLHPCRAYAIREREGGTQAMRIESFNDAFLSQFELGTFESISYAGAKAVEQSGHKKQHTQAWIIYPPSFNERKKYPLLHSIHGGPHTASGDTWHYRWNNQVFASGNGTQDYVVVCVNYHGSTSFGYQFKDSITHHWGELELKDIEAATSLMLKKPFIDSKHVYATGGSYGGYMVAWMNAHVKKGRYQAYVCHAGCFDWVGMFADDAFDWHGQELGAWYWNDMQKIHAQSPHAYAKQFSTPTLVIHGALDYRVPDAQGLAYYNTLKAKGIPAKLIWYPDENHWVLKPQNSTLWYREFFDWLQRF
jgi:dipeptidyl aminopeptidase/acylaminoacyl peptidase